MYYEIVELQQFSGSEAKVYSLIPRDDVDTLFEQFVDEYRVEFKEEVKSLLQTLVQIGNTTGARSSFFKQHEGKYGDFVCALFDVPERHLRLYCIRFGMVAVILGGGGEKAKGIRAWQDDEKLAKEANRMIEYAKDILQRLDEGDLYWSKDKTEIQGNLKNYDNE